MEVKEKTTLTGTLLCPLVVGKRAVIFHRGRIIRTHEVVEIHSIEANEICFETRETYYRLVPSPRPQVQEAARQLVMMAA